MNILDFTQIILRQSFLHISDLSELLDEYYMIKNKNYNDELSDMTMIMLLKKYDKLGKGKEFNIFYVKNIYVPYIDIINKLTHEEIKINQDRYKNDCIKKLLSSEFELNEIIYLIENILFNEKIDNFYYN